MTRSEGLAALRVRDGGAELLVRLTPRADRDGFDGLGSDADGRNFAKVRLRAVPEGGKANKALLKLVARSCGVPVSAVSIASGQLSRVKTLRVSGEFATIERRLKQYLVAPG